MKKFNYLRFASYPMIAAALLGCNLEEVEKRKFADLSIRLTDAPFSTDALKSVLVKVSTIEMRLDGKLQVLSDEEVTYDILSLRGGLTETLVNKSIPAGRLDMLRLKIDSAVVELKDGRVFDMKIPSGASSGLKIFMEPAIQVGEGSLSHDLVLDFDISKSFVPLSGGSDLKDIEGFNFNPVIRVANSSIHGSIAGRIYSDMCTPSELGDDKPLDLALAQAVRDGEVVASAATDEEGNFVLFGLEPGTYDVLVSSSAHGEKLFEAQALAANESYVGEHLLAGKCYSLSGNVFGDNLTPDLDSDDQALGGASIGLYDANGMFLDEVTSEADGSFDLGLLFQGDYQLSVSADKHTPKEIDLSGFSSSEPLNLVLTEE